MTNITPPTDPDFFPLTELAKRFVNQLTQCRRLEIEVHEASEHHVLMELPYSEQHIGYPDTGVIHGGVITTLMDTACGCATICAIKKQFDSLEISPTLDLRVDYMKSAKPNQSVFVLAECYRLTSSIAFTRAIAYQDSIDDPIAHAVGAFMRISSEMIGDEFRDALMGEGDGPQFKKLNSQEELALSTQTSTTLKTKEPLDVKGIVKKASELNDFSYLLMHVPYAKFIGMSVERFGYELVFRLPANDHNIGNPVLPAIHGGVIAGFMEMSAIVQLMVFMHTEKVPKIVDFSIDYLRAGYHKDTFVECHITRQGRRVANVNINCWQSNRKQLIATARAHFLIE
ncbi:PaaI family thioesterase [Parashewanella spongiae]|uniref:PaaI family thioesterase n=1 Tax=Parashewanella spongiae TaxID=342950 RepID=A0A3A6TPY1_9GAMM|nr:PaaI family thioesterase [Parashewanella spongiae]MCL1077889.1 PaaI family thioesterase [Parashewanella spongiae]RJY14952.1 PaaI family thioesterase [Parashewanella spongiae]